MDLVQNGESSKSPRTNGVLHIAPGADRMEVDGPTDVGHKESASTLIMPEWDVPPQKPLHPSLDLISLLHLDGYFNTYVRPFADDPTSNAAASSTAPNNVQEGDRKPSLSLNGVVPLAPAQAGQAGQRQQQKKGGKKQRLEKGYQHLLEDCIDPTPLGAKADSHSLLPLVQDLTQPPTGAPPDLQYLAGSIDVLPLEAFKSARLEAGLKQDGYAGGEKIGVREAEERRKKKRAGRALTIDPTLPSPSAAPGAFPSPGLPIQPGTPGTPLLPVAPPSRSFPLNTTRRPTAPPSFGSVSGGPVRPFSTSSAATQNGSRPYAPNKRPGSAEVQLGPQHHKRAKSGSGSRSASPLPHPGQVQQAHQSAQRKLPPGMRSRTEGL